MLYPLDTIIDLNPRTNNKYIVSSLHRRKRNNKKSLWTISRDEEIDCFILSQKSQWTEVNVSWGIKLEGNSIKQIGVNKQNKPLKIAKFIYGNCNNIWHGYPADHVRNNQDRPGILTLKKWRIAGYIEKHIIEKIRKGKECNL